MIEDALHINFTPIPANLNETNLRNLELAVNVGSNCFYTSDESQLTWLPDQPYTESSWGYIGGESKIARHRLRIPTTAHCFKLFATKLKGIVSMFPTESTR